MKNQTIVKRYAQALLSLGLEDGLYDQYGLELEQLAKAIAGVGEASKTLTSPAFPQKMREKILEAILEKASLHSAVSNFARLLMEKRRFGELEAIAEAYKVLADAENGVIRAKVTTAASLGQGEIDKIKAALTIFAGKKVELSVVEDISIIGGLVARLGDLTIDGSVRTQLSKLARILEN
jgi:F-type H+-transporting ATPase subunit delta